ncbi:MAG: thymidylate synthase [Candidatus Pacebacteria bacterium]|nr:thymidylate synthase [Candidatus Paceibacterota bacterium]
MVQGRTLPEVWEKSLTETWNKGVPVKTQYDQPTDPPSRDVSMVLVIEEPFAEPRIHKSFPGGLENLEIYRQEVVEGVHDYWINPEEGKWTYTYHQRLFNYLASIRGDKNKVLNLLTPEKTPVNAVNQIQFIIDSLAKSPFSRRAQGITYMPSYDQGTEDPPCLQRVWCRIVYGENGEWVLNMNTHWRSRDAFKAAFMNIFALTDLQRYIAEEVSKKAGRPVKIGRYADMIDSYHVYGSYFKDFEGFLESVAKRSFESRLWDSNEEMVQGAFEEGKAILANEKATGQKGMASSK